MDIKEEDLVLSSGMGSGDDLSTETLEEFDSTCFQNTDGESNAKVLSRTFIKIFEFVLRQYWTLRFHRIMYDSL